MIVNYLKFLILLKLITFAFYNLSYSKSFEDFKNSIIQEGLQKGISDSVLKENLNSIKNINKKVLKLYNNQPEFKITLAEYKKRNITTKRIETGKKLITKHKNILNEITNKYNVPAAIIVSIWALESNFGYYTGSFNIIDALTTLSYQSKRRIFFKKELFSALKILDNKNIEASLLKGSWAGAMGQSQFMPSSYLSYAVDFNKDKKIDIWNTHSDVFASIANYLKLHGWKKNEPWSYKFKIANADTNTIDFNKKYTYKELKGSIVLNQQNKVISDDINTQIKSIASNNSVENFLVFKNFFILKKYNNSDFYAITVGTLANKIQLENE